METQGFISRTSRWSDVSLEVQCHDFFTKSIFRALIEPIKIFNWSNTNELYINLNASITNQKFLTGDEKGRIWIYKVFFTLQMIFLQIRILA